MKRKLSPEAQAQQDKRLLTAARAGDLAGIRAALKAGADIHVNDNSQNGNDNPLEKAASNNHIEAVRLLIAEKANIHSSDNWALRTAGMQGNIEIVRLLLENGASLDNRALADAAGCGRLKVINLLLDSGADIAADDNSAIKSAMLEGQTKAVRLLFDRGANLTDEELHDCIWRAACHGYRGVVELLLEKGCTASSDDVTIAASNGHWAIVDILLEDIFQPQKWRGKTVGDINAMAARLLEDIEAFNRADQKKVSRLMPKLRERMEAPITMLLHNIRTTKARAWAKRHAALKPAQPKPL